MEKLRKAVNEIAYTQHYSKLSHLQRSLIPILFFASSFYSAALSLRRALYDSGLLAKHRLPVPVISVGNLTWGGNGKTPMVEFIANYLADSGISPLILTRHWSLKRNLEIVMINGLTLWGNCHLIPRGPLREPLDALRQADVVVLHHADLVSEQNLKDTGLMLREVNKSVPVFFTKMYPCYFFNVGNATFRKPVGDLLNAIVLCVSAIGSAKAFTKAIEKIGAFYVDRIEFSDHHIFLTKDFELIKGRLRELDDRLSKPVVIVTEKDYDRDPTIFNHLDPFEVLVLCSKLKIIPNRGCTEDSFKKLLKEVFAHEYVNSS
ncbi:probable tetraacyldisaccharide 4'-kinase, mitochondrial isoform X3 [Argentina anserina]|uniref:probable tetraacyldisaccharide 4'-kinase, mitochondrial isoform X3 n=1 Tax=Argentina anserina TaxID=57926 RepID=UPI0021762003|nr:probable tetraacyldisaccharide 4'-kinase, mitochondrial isoform X3 [Potentilla anserina]